MPVRELRFADYARDWWLWDKCSYVRGRLARSSAKKPAISQRHVKEMRSILEAYALPAFGKLRLSAISPLLIEEWMFSLLDRGLSPKRVNNICSCLRKMLTEARRLGLLHNNPFEAVRPFAANSQERGILSIDEVKKLFDPHKIKMIWEGHLLYRVINELAAATGMRQGEILAVRVEDVHDGYIHVAHSWHAKYGLGPTKTRQERDVPVPLRVIEDVGFFIDAAERGFVFSFNLGKSPASGARTTEALYKALEKIGISKEERKHRNITFHSWRHFFNSLMRSRAVPTPILQRVIGHLTPMMTERYTHFALADFGEVIDAQGEVFE